MPDQGWWRDGNRVVVARDSELPKVCVRCGEPGSQQISRKLSWVSRWYLLVAVVGLIFYIIAASIAAKRSRLTFWLCESHAAARRRDVRIGWLGIGMIVLSFLMLIYGGSVVPRSALAVLPIVEMLLLVGGLAISLFGYYRSRIVSAAKIDDAHVWLKGVNTLIRESLPPFAPEPDRGPVQAVSTLLKCPKCWNTNEPNRTACRICGAQLSSPVGA